MSNKVVITKTSGVDNFMELHKNSTDIGKKLFVPSEAGIELDKREEVLVLDIASNGSDYSMILPLSLATAHQLSQLLSRAVEGYLDGE